MSRWEGKTRLSMIIQLDLFVFALRSFVQTGVILHTRSNRPHAERFLRDFFLRLSIHRPSSSIASHFGCVASQRHSSTHTNTRPTRPNQQNTREKNNKKLKEKKNYNKPARHSPQFTETENSILCKHFYDRIRIVMT